ncbi:MAG: four helix bundle protein [Ruminococcus sp.]|nr:four helix bundle protein [Ruminococcus sp.]
MDNIIEIKSFDFAVRIVKLYRFLCEQKKEYVLSKQLLRSGTSIGANIAEAQQAQSKADFISKVSISLKEASETKYWISLLNATNYLSEKEVNSILSDCVEIEKILFSILKTSKTEN